MTLLSIILIAIGLSMDAFAVSVSIGLNAEKDALNKAFTAGSFFGLFQAGMTALGFLVGYSLIDLIRPVDHWVAFVLLGIIGGKMIYEAVKGDGEPIDLCGLKMILTLPLATSIDALAAGISIASTSTPILFPSLAIGLTTFLLSFAGVYIGRMLSSNRRFSSVVDIIGGIILMGIGLKILVEHLTA